MISDNKKTPEINISKQQQKENIKNSYLPIECIGHCERTRYPAICVDNMCGYPINYTTNRLAYILCGSDY